MSARRGAAPRPASRAVCSGVMNDASVIAASLPSIPMRRPLRGSTRPRRRVGKLQSGWPRGRLDELLPDAWARSSLVAPATGDAGAS